MKNPFLTARWRNLIMANYEVDPALLTPHLPAHTELDLWRGRCYVSLVGFLFEDTRVMGWKIPGHVNFPEFNLRFYVRHRAGDEWRRGTVFIQEIVPRRAISWVANHLYGEHYRTLPMDHSWEEAESSWRFTYRWKLKGTWNHLRAVTGNERFPLQEGSEEGFITEHYWGYTRLSGRRTSEFAVEHPRWDVYEVRAFDLHCDAGELYGAVWAQALQEPASVLVAAGSEIAVGRRRLIS